MIGLNEQAWEIWVEYRKARKKNYKTEYGRNLAMKKLASFGEWQMESVLKCKGKEWVDLYCITEREIAELQKARRATNKRDMMLAELTERARKCGYREPQPTEDLDTFKCLVERREREVADERWRKARSGPGPIRINQLMGKL